MALLAGGCGDGGPPTPRNVVLISLDTVRADHLSLYGYERETSPNLERLGAESVVFDLAIAQAAATLPSHLALFQSRPAAKTASDLPMLAEVLRRSGFRTAAFVGGGMVAARFGFADGFDHYYESEEPHRTFSDTLPRLESWLAEQEVDEPTFLFLHTYDPHHPYDPPEPWRDHFDPGYAGPITGAATGPLLNKVRQIHGHEDDAGEVELSPADRHKIESLYDDDLRYTDHFIPRILEALERQGWAENTLLVVLSDHGEEFWDHGSVLHSFTVYQEMVRVPLLFRFPGGLHGGARIAETARLIDVAPTILDILDLRQPESFEGSSLLPAIGRSAPGPQRAAMSEAYSIKSWLDHPWKLIVDRESRSVELYDLADDPGEQHDLSEEQPERVRQLHRQLATAFEGLMATEIVDVPADETIEDPELREQLRALGYIN